MSSYIGLLQTVNARQPPNKGKYSLVHHPGRTDNNYVGLSEVSAVSTTSREICTFYGVIVTSMAKESPVYKLRLFSSKIDILKERYGVIPDILVRKCYDDLYNLIVHNLFSKDFDYSTHLITGVPLVLANLFLCCTSCVDWSTRKASLNLHLSSIRAHIMALSELHMEVSVLVLLREFFFESLRYPFTLWYYWCQGAFQACEMENDFQFSE